MKEKKPTIRRTTMNPTILLNDQIRHLLAQLMTKDDQPLIRWMTSLKVEDGNVMMVFESPPERTKEIEALRQKAEPMVQELASVNQVRSVLTTQRPSTKIPPKPQEPELLPNIRQILAIASGKGGVG